MIKEPKYYFVCYECDTLFSGELNKEVTEKNQKIIDYHPLRFEIESNKKSGEWLDCGGGIKTLTRYRVISWQSLTVEEYNEFKDKIG